MRKRLGLIVNPVAGMGGKVGLKGTDGPEILKRAMEGGATPESPQRAIQALESLIDLRDAICIVTYPGDMGENEVKYLGFEYTVLGSIKPGATTPEDTERAALEIRDSGVEILLFAGGDGTARNVFNAIGDKLLTLGIPAGVKIHSAVFGTTPRNAGQLVRLFLEGKATRTREAEVMDIDEEAFRNQRVSAQLYGYLEVPFDRRLVQSIKTGQAGGEDSVVKAIALDVIRNMQPEYYYIIGPGTTTREIMKLLGIPNTLLGVDVIRNKSLIASDVNETQLLQTIGNDPTRIVVTIIGGQGYIFGRGNQQISPRVIQRVGRENIIVVATKDKVLSLHGNPLLVDTGDEAVNDMLAGYIHVTTGLKEKLVCRVSFRQEAYLDSDDDPLELI